MVDEALEGVEYRESLKPLLEQLPPREKKILLLRFFGNMTQSQIATELGISQMHVSRLLARRSHRPAPSRLQRALTQREEGGKGQREQGHRREQGAVLDTAAERAIRDVGRCSHQRDGLEETHPPEQPHASPDLSQPSGPPVASPQRRGPAYPRR
jgi:hypothetical protein